MNVLSHVSGNMCICYNGVAEIGPHCPVNGGAKCKSCNAGWTMNRDRTKCICTYVSVTL